MQDNEKWEYPSNGVAFANTVHAKIRVSFYKNHFSPPKIRFVSRRIHNILLFCSAGDEPVHGILSQAWMFSRSFAFLY